jgi:hypothetical protein
MTIWSEAVQHQMLKTSKYGSRRKRDSLAADFHKKRAPSGVSAVAFGRGLGEVPDGEITRRRTESFASMGLRLQSQSSWTDKVRNKIDLSGKSVIVRVEQKKLPLLNPD